MHKYQQEKMSTALSPDCASVAPESPAIYRVLDRRYCLRHVSRGSYRCAWSCNKVSQVLRILDGCSPTPLQMIRRKKMRHYSERFGNYVITDDFVWFSHTQSLGQHDEAAFLCTPSMTRLYLVKGMSADPVAATITWYA